MYTPMIFILYYQLINYTENNLDFSPFLVSNLEGNFEQD